MKTLAKLAMFGLVAVVGIPMCAAVVGISDNVDTASTAGNSAEPQETKSQEEEKKEKEEKSQPKQKERDLDDGVRGVGYKIAQKGIKPHLKAPSEAEFPWDKVEHQRIDDLLDKAPAWIVTGVVDAPNSFGAKLRGEWAVGVYTFKQGGQRRYAAYQLDYNGQTIWQEDETTLRRRIGQ